MGPGTGLGEGILTKSAFSKCHEVFSSEGGHTDFAVRNEQDWKLMQFAMNYIENSNNIENQRGKAKLDRMSTERLCAGPAVPLIYQFLKSEYPELKSVLEE
jgi:glucokinase